MNEGENVQLITVFCCKWALCRERMRIALPPLRLLGSHGLLAWFYLAQVRRRFSRNTVYPQEDREANLPHKEFKSTQKLTVCVCPCCSSPVCMYFLMTIASLADVVGRRQPEFF